LRIVPTIKATPNDRLGMPSEIQRAKILDQRDIGLSGLTPQGTEG